MARARLAASAIALAAAAAAFVLVWQRGFPLARYRVGGSSMMPAYQPGDSVLIYRWAYRRRSPAAGDAVVLRDPERDGHCIVKRAAFDADRGGSVYVLGDNAAESRDSRTFGDVSSEAIVGRVVLRY